MKIRDRFRKSWNAFLNKDPTDTRPVEIGISSSRRPDRVRYTRGNERTIITSIYNRIAMDVSALNFNHVKLDENDRFDSIINSGLNTCLTLEANIDQTGRAFIQDVVASLLDEGCVCILPVDTDSSPENGSFDISSMRVARVVTWYPRDVRVEAYNDRKGIREQVTVSKDAVAIIENPLYSVMNESNSTMQRLIRKLSLMDYVDEESSSGKLDLIIQLPYVIKSEARKKQAEDRRRQIEDQLKDSRYGVAYTDGTEKIVQLNRPLENNLLKQIEYLTEQLYSQLGLTQEVLNGSADEKTMLNYYNRVVEPIASAIVDELKRKFLTKTARTQKQSVLFFRDPFKLVPMDNLADIADKFIRNEILTKNEFRQKIGMTPSSDPSADELRNPNISEPKEEAIEQLDVVEQNPDNPSVSKEDDQNGQNG